MVEVRWDGAAGESACVGAVVVVVVEVAGEFARQAVVADVEVPVECRSPAVLEDRSV